jgi:hypothetical protein
MSQHTPGPWVWTSDEKPIDLRTWESPGYYDNPILMGPNGEDIAGNGEYNTLSDNMADNYLIAAAPAMLEALKDGLSALQAWEHTLRERMSDKNYDRVRTKFEQAIAQAEGKV